MGENNNKKLSLGTVIGVFLAFIVPLICVIIPLFINIGIIKTKIDDVIVPALKSNAVTIEEISQTVTNNTKEIENFNLKMTSQTEKINENIEKLTAQISTTVKKINNEIIPALKKKPGKEISPIEFEEIKLSIRNLNEGFNNLDTRVASIQQTITGTFSAIAEVFSEGVQTIEGEYWSINNMEQTIEVFVGHPVVDTRPTKYSWDLDTQVLAEGKEWSLANYGKIDPGKNVKIKFYKLRPFNTCNQLNINSL